MTWPGHNTVTVCVQTCAEKKKMVANFKKDTYQKEEACEHASESLKLWYLLMWWKIHKCVWPPPPQFWPLFDRWSEVAKRRSPPPPITMLNSCVAVTTAWPAVTPIRPATDGAGSWEKGQGTDTALTSPTQIIAWTHKSADMEAHV